MPFKWPFPSGISSKPLYGPLFYPLCLSHSSSITFFLIFHANNILWAVHIIKCWGPYREGQISTLDRVQKKAAKFTHHTNSPNWETLASRRKLLRICALFKAYSRERAWKAIGDRLQWPHYLSRVDHERKIRSRRQRTDLEKYSFVNRTIQHWNQLPAEVLRTLPCKPITF